MEHLNDYRLEPPEERDPTNLEQFESCVHCGACEAVYRLLKHIPSEYDDMSREIADALMCTECDQYDW